MNEVNRIVTEMWVGDNGKSKKVDTYMPQSSFNNMLDAYINSVNDEYVNVFNQKNPRTSWLNILCNNITIGTCWT